MTKQIKFYTSDDGTVRMPLPNNWVEWRNVLHSDDFFSFLTEEMQPILKEPGVKFSPHYLQIHFDSMEDAIQFKLKYL
jgi:hypothetical protein